MSSVHDETSIRTSRPGLTQADGSRSNNTVVEQLLDQIRRKKMELAWTETEMK